MIRFPRPHRCLLSAIAVICWLSLATPVAGQVVGTDELGVAEDALEDARAALRKGRLSLAISLLDEVFEIASDRDEEVRPATLSHARYLWFDIKLRRGEYSAIRVALTRPDAPAGPKFARLLASVSKSTGEYDAAVAIHRKLLSKEPNDAVARYALGELLQYTGALPSAKKEFDACIDRGRDATSAQQLTAIARAHLALGGRSNIEAASRLLIEAINKDESAIEPLLALGQLKFDVYGEAAGYPSGEADLKQVLKRHGDIEAALLGLYRIRRSNMNLDYGRTGEYLERALGQNKNSVPARIERSLSAIQDRNFQLAKQELDRALSVNGKDKVALAHRAAVAHLMGEADDADRLRETALEVDPTFEPELNRYLGDHLVTLYRFPDAVPIYEAALVADPDSVPALHGYGKALIYSGRGEDAVGHLERAKQLQRGFVNPWRNNALAIQDLLAEEYVTIQTEGFEFRMHRDDAAVLRAYLPRWHEEAMAVLGKKYGVRPEGKVRVEVFHKWSEFSIRTIGFRGFSALGACFGRFITLVSPSDDLLRRQNFMWSATVWHEFAHVLTLALSDQRVPRWLTEGLSVYEERQKNPAWERGMDRALLDAFVNRDIPPVRLLNRLFRGSRILFGYFQGGLTVERLTERFGFSKVVEFLLGYRTDKSTEQLFREVFGESSKDFDKDFLEWIENTKLKDLNIRPSYNDRSIDRMLETLAGKPGDLDTRLALGWGYAQRGQDVDAAEQLRQIFAVDRDHIGSQLLHAELYRRRKAGGDAVAAYRRGFDGGADDFDSRVRFGRLLEATGDAEGALEQFQRAKACWPHCTEEANAPNLLLAALLRKHGRRDDALLELKSYVARTARAFGPRLQLAAMEREQGNHAAAAKLLEEAIQIDPFMRSLHEQLAAELLQVGRTREAVEELIVALAVRPNVDRAHLRKRQKPDPESEEERGARAQLCVRIGDLLRTVEEPEKARRFFERAQKEAPGSPAAGTAADRLRDH